MYVRYRWKCCVVHAVIGTLFLHSCHVELRHIRRQNSEFDVTIMTQTRPSASDWIMPRDVGVIRRISFLQFSHSVPLNSTCLSFMYFSIFNLFSFESLVSQTRITLSLWCHIKLNSVNPFKFWLITSRFYTNCFTCGERIMGDDQGNKWEKVTVKYF
jgi:hypothetical protein